MCVVCVYGRQGTNREDRGGGGEVGGRSPEGSYSTLRELKQASKCHCYLETGPHVAQVGEELVEANDDRELLLFLFPPLGCLYYKATGHYSMGCSWSSLVPPACYLMTLPTELRPQPQEFLRD